MEQRLQIPYPILVEGKYDRQRLLCVADATIITTDGFGIFKKAEKAALIRALGAKSPVIVLTDSDGAGRLIRSHLSGLLPPDRVIPLYVPRIPGKEKRKAEPSAEGILGVEGMELTLLRDLLAPYEDGGRVAGAADNPLSMADFYRDGLTGCEGSAAARDALAIRFSLPPGMSAKALLAALRFLCSYEEYERAVERDK